MRNARVPALRAAQGREERKLGKPRPLQCNACGTRPPYSAVGLSDYRSIQVWIADYTFPMFVAIIGVMWLFCFLGIPILVLFSIREWATNHRATLPALRSGIGLISVGCIFSGWLFLVALAVLGIINTTWLDFFTQKRNLNFLMLAIAASVLSLTLKGSARVQALAAGALLVLFAMLWLSREMP